MKFDCGKPAEWYGSAAFLSELVEEAARVAVPKAWFAWYPVRVGDNDCRWLETVMRSYPYSMVMARVAARPDYRLKTMEAHCALAEPTKYIPLRFFVDPGRPQYSALP